MKKELVLSVISSITLMIFSLRLFFADVSSDSPLDEGAIWQLKLFCLVIGIVGSVLMMAVPFLLSDRLE
jgi:hypothetical protein